MEHDACYRTFGRDHPQCDAQFVSNLQAISYQAPYIPGQMKAAYSYFLSRLYGTVAVQGTLSPIDLVTLGEAGSQALCGP